jgi:hypothetical protein
LSVPDLDRSEIVAGHRQDFRRRALVKGDQSIVRMNTVKLGDTQKVKARDQNVSA